MAGRQLVWTGLGFSMRVNTYRLEYLLIMPRTWTAQMDAAVTAGMGTSGIDALLRIGYDNALLVTFKKLKPVRQKLWLCQSSVQALVVTQINNLEPA